LTRKRQTNRAAHTPAHFQLVNKVGLRGIEGFERGVRPQCQDYAAALRTLPLFDYREPQATSVELDGLVKPLNRQDETHFVNCIEH